MSLTRDAVQGFIDGYLKAGGDIDKVPTDMVDWMDKHPVYPQSKELQAAILSDIESYRGVVKPAPTPAPVQEDPIP